MKEPDIPLSKFLRKLAADPTIRNRAGPRCWVCKEPLIAAEVLKFFKLKKGDNSDAKEVSWSIFCQLHLRGQMGWRGTYSSLMGHVRNHLGQDG
jgi:hypothetical protein